MPTPQDPTNYNPLLGAANWLDNSQSYGYSDIIDGQATPLGPQLSAGDILGLGVDMTPVGDVDYAIKSKEAGDMLGVGIGTGSAALSAFPPTGIVKGIGKKLVKTLSDIELPAFKRGMKEGDLSEYVPSARIRDNKLYMDAEEGMGLADWLNEYDLDINDHPGFMRDLMKDLPEDFDIGGGLTKYQFDDIHKGTKDIDVDAINRLYAGDVIDVTAHENSGKLADEIIKGFKKGLSTSDAERILGKYADPSYDLSKLDADEIKHMRKEINKAITKKKLKVAKPHELKYQGDNVKLKSGKIPKDEELVPGIIDDKGNLHIGAKGDIHASILFKGIGKMEGPPKHSVFVTKHGDILDRYKAQEYIDEIEKTKGDLRPSKWRSKNLGLGAEELMEEHTGQNIPTDKDWKLIKEIIDDLGKTE